MWQSGASAVRYARSVRRGPAPIIHRRTGWSSGSTDLRGTSSIHRVYNFELVYGREVRGPLHILKEAPGQGREESIVSYVLSVQERLSNVGVGEG